MRCYYYLPIFLLFILFSCQNSIDNTSQTEVQEIVGLGESIKVRTKRLVQKPFEYVIRTNGKIKSVEDHVVINETFGQIRLFNIRPGLHVEKGVSVCFFDTTEAKIKQERAIAKRFNCLKEYESLKLGYINLTTGLSDKEVLLLDQKLKTASGLTDAELDIKEAEYQLSKLIIKAPFSGTVADLKVVDKQFVKSGEPLFRIYNPEKLFLEVKVLESDISYLKNGTPCIVFPISQPDKKILATLVNVNPAVDENGIIIVNLRIDKSNRTSNLFPGMNCEAVIQIPLKKGIVVPKESVTIRNNRTVIFTFNNGKANWNFVTIGRDNGKEVEVLSGLKEGDKIIISNNMQLVHDTQVEEIAEII